MSSDPRRFERFAIGVIRSAEMAGPQLVYVSGGHLQSVATARCNADRVSDDCIVGVFGCDADPVEIIEALRHHLGAQSAITVLVDR